MKTLLSHSLKALCNYYRCVKRTERRKIKTEQTRVEAYEPAKT